MNGSPILFDLLSMGSINKGFVFLSGKKIPYADLKSVSTENLSEHEQEVLNALQAWQSGESIFEVQSSGTTTGSAKTCCLQRKQIEDSIGLTFQVFSIPQNLPLVANLRVGHVGGLMAVLRAIETGRDLWVLPSTSRPLSFLDHVGKLRYGMISLVPFHVERLISENQLDLLSAFHTVLIGGAPVSAQLISAMQTVSSNLYQTFGMAETCSLVAYRRINPLEVHYQVLPEHEVKTDEEGCLIFRGAVSRFQKICTRDQGVLIDEKHFSWIGRKDDVINSGGIKIHLVGIEEEIRSCLLKEGRQVPSFCCVGEPDSQLGERLVWVIEGEEWSDEKQQDHLKLLLQQLPPYHNPKKIKFLKQLPRTQIGKLIRRYPLPSTDYKG
ncbi:MAG: AMP-binding protein [Cytophagales bacterium]|nr:AMP-binding protein [Cytophagales bacterium]